MEVMVKWLNMDLRKIFRFKPIKSKELNENAFKEFLDKMKER